MLFGGVMAHIICNVHINNLLWAWLMISHLIAVACYILSRAKRKGENVRTQTDPISDHSYRIVIEPDNNIEFLINDGSVHI